MDLKRIFSIISYLTDLVKIIRGFKSLSDSNISVKRDNLGIQIPQLKEKIKETPLTVDNLAG